MKKIVILTLANIVSFQFLFAGGIITNTNQSAMFTRMLARDAMLDLDAIYYNPAGVATFADGIYLSLNNQSIIQSRTIISDYANLNNKEYTGSVTVPFFPGIYAAYKRGPLAVSFGFNPIGGGGGGIYNDGLPAFEYPISDLVPALISEGQDIQGYRMDGYIKGTSVFNGYQLNLSYQVNNMLSLSIGARLVTARESYIGHLKDVQLNLGGTWLPASTYFTNIATQSTSFAQDASGAASSLSLLIAGTLGAAAGLTLAEAETAGYINPTDRASLEGGLATIGYTTEQINAMTITQSQAAFSGAATSLYQTANEATAKSRLLVDQDVDVEKTATGITPIISFNISPNDKMNISLKYEHNTKIEFENNTRNDFLKGFDDNGDSITMYPHGVKARLDIPGQIVAGVTYKPMDKLLVSTGFHYYLDKGADWNGRDTLLDGNLIEWALGFEYNVTEKLKASIGYLITKPGVTEKYQNNLSYSLPTSTIGLGIGYKINEMLEVNVGGSYTMYNDGDKNFDHDFAGTGTMVPIKENYDKDNLIVGVGINISLGSE